MLTEGVAMKLFILRPREGLSLAVNPWEPWYNKTFGFVIRAKNEEIARMTAALTATDDLYADSKGKEGQQAWIQSKFSTCEELAVDGPEGIIIADEHWA